MRDLTMEGAELDLFRSGLRRATVLQTGEELDRTLAEMGWHDALPADAAPAVSALFESQGHANASSSALDDVVAYGLGVEAPAGCVVLLAPLGRTVPPARLTEGALTVSGLATARLARQEHALVVASAGPHGETSAAVVSTSVLSRRVIEGMDPSLGLSEVVAGNLDTVAWQPLGTEAWPTAVGLAQLALGHELLGASTAMLELACEHARQRIQFDRPIAGFQAVRHRLADTFVALEAARALLDEAWEARVPTSTSMAKAVAGRAAYTAARHCQQVLAGMGFTTEHPLQRYIRRVFVLDQLFGSSAALTRGLGQELAGSRRLPAQRPL